MRFSVEVMRRCLYLLRLGVSLVPDGTKHQGFTKHRAIVVGHMVRIVKLYEGAAIHISQQQCELALVLFRLIVETAIRMIYLITSPDKRKSCQSFILSSYKPEREMLRDLKDKRIQRSLIPIERRMRRSILSTLRKDRITQSRLNNNKKWSVDGKNVRDMMNEVGFEKYAYSFGNGSHFVHGDWLEMRKHHLQRDGRYYVPKLEYSDSDPRVSYPLTNLCLDVLLRYLVWSKGDPTRAVISVVEKLLILNASVDAEHERSLGG